MKTKLITIILGIFLIGIVTAAITYGSIFTQNDIDNVNTETRDLDTQWTESFSQLQTKCLGVNVCSRAYEIDGFEKQMLFNETDNSTYWSGKYIYIRENKAIRFKTKWVYDIQEESGTSEAKLQLSEFLNKRLDMEIHEQRISIKAVQTEIIYDISNTLNT